MSGRKVYLVHVPVTKYVPIKVTSSMNDPASVLESAGAIARMNLADDSDGIEVVHSDQQPWIVSNEDGSSPARFEKIHIPGEGMKWVEAGKKQKGYGY